MFLAYLKALHILSHYNFSLYDYTSPKCNFLKGANIAHHLVVRSVGSCLCFMKYPPISQVFLPQKTAFPIFMWPRVSGQGTSLQMCHYRFLFLKFLLYLSNCLFILVFFNLMPAKHFFSICFEGYKLNILTWLCPRRKCSRSPWHQNWQDKSIVQIRH